MYVVLFMYCPGEDWKHHVRVLSTQSPPLGKIQVKGSFKIKLSKI